MKISAIATNQTIVERDNGVEVFVSYRTPVAAFVPGRGYLRSATTYSRTTSKHINAWIRGIAEEVPQAEIDALMAGWPVSPIPPLPALPVARQPSD